MASLVATQTLHADLNALRVLLLLLLLSVHPHSIDNPFDIIKVYCSLRLSRCPAGVPSHHSVQSASQAFGGAHTHTHILLALIRLAKSDPFHLLLPAMSKESSSVTNSISMCSIDAALLVRKREQCSDSLSDWTYLLAILWPLLGDFDLFLSLLSASMSINIAVLSRYARWLIASSFALVRPVNRLLALPFIFTLCCVFSGDSAETAATAFA